MRVLFLDIDGVLNSDDFLTLAHAASGLSVTKFRADPWRHLDPVLVARLNRVVATTGAVVILSSDWRKAPRNPGVDGTQAALDRVGATFHLAGATPVLPGKTWRGACRGDECQAWLDAHPAVTAWAAVDDRDDFGAWPSRLVQTDPMVGLTDADADRLIALLTEKQ